MDMKDSVSSIISILNDVSWSKMTAIPLAIVLCSTRELGESGYMEKMTFQKAPSPELWF